MRQKVLSTAGLKLLIPSLVISVVVFNLRKYVALSEDVLVFSTTDAILPIVSLNTTSTINDEATLSSSKPEVTRDKKLGTIVLLAPARWAKYHFYALGHKTGDRFCLLAHAIQSIDKHLNSHYGPYDINIVYASDLNPNDPNDVPYTPADFDFLREFVDRERRPLLHFHPVEMYSGEALEPDTTVEMVNRWRNGENGAVKGRDLGYQSMCRLWSGRLQQMSFLDEYEYYMRMDDDSCLVADVTADPFVRMRDEGHSYAYKRESGEPHGIQVLSKVAQGHVDFDIKSPFLVAGLGETRFRYIGQEPYNNFHITTVDFWRSPRWLAIWEDANKEHLFLKYRVGDANVHAIAVIMMHQNNMTIGKWRTFEYIHNTNDDRSYPPAHWGEVCNATYRQYGIVQPRKKDQNEAA